MTNTFKFNFYTQTTMEYKLQLATTDAVIEERSWHETGNTIHLQAATLAIKEANELRRALRKDP